MQTTIRELIDRVLSLQWCRENIVIPIDIDNKSGKETALITVAVANFSYLGTIGDFIKKRASSQGLECQFIEKDPEEIQRLLDLASREGGLYGETLDSYEFDDDTIINALRAAESEGDADGISFEFDDSEEIVIEEDTVDLAAEMLGSQIQKAAAQILITSCRCRITSACRGQQELN